MIIKKETQKTINLSATLQEIFLLAKWMNRNICQARLDILSNGCDLIDYYYIKIYTDKLEDHSTHIKNKNNISKFIRNLNQNSNFGGVRKNEYWISEKEASRKDYKNPCNLI